MTCCWVFVERDYVGSEVFDGMFLRVFFSCAVILPASGFDKDQHCGGKWINYRLCPPTPNVCACVRVCVCV